MHEMHPERIIPGEEVRTREGIDLIGLFIHQEIPKGTPAREAVDHIREQGGVVYLPHPFASGKGGGGRFAQELAPLVDVVEVFNARVHPRRLNDPARELAGAHVKLAGAGSDAHTVGELGSAFVELPGHPNEPGALLEALKAGRIHGRTSSPLVHLASTWAKLRRKLPGGGWKDA
jgi:predicted metal-dependent phosphoesterase TrpH